MPGINRRSMFHLSPSVINACHNIIDGEMGQKDDHELSERKLSYAALSRARASASLSFPLKRRGRKKASRPSRFLRKLRSKPRAMGSPVVSVGTAAATDDEEEEDDDDDDNSDGPRAPKNHVNAEKSLRMSFSSLSDYQRCLTATTWAG